jgi:hypothetical protein
MTAGADKLHAGAGHQQQSQPADTGANKHHTGVWGIPLLVAFLACRHVLYACKRALCGMWARGGGAVPPLTAPSLILP